MNRRSFIKLCAKSAALGGAGSGFAVAAPSADPTQFLGGRRVAVFGGGVGGLTTAHELAERGFEVTVYERRQAVGGKARSFSVAGTGTGGRGDLPGEHGFRFFPGFYRHLPDTLSRIPDGGHAVLDNLIATTEMLMARTQGPDVQLPAGWPRSPADLAELLRAASGNLASPADLDFFAKRLHVLMTSCPERRLGEWEAMSWWSFVRADQRSADYQLLAAGLCRSLVALQPRLGSARTVGYTLLRLLRCGMDPSTKLDSVLNGPTSEAWIDPWRQHLEALGVRFALGQTLTGLALDGGAIVGAAVQDADGLVAAVDADFFVAALPVDAMTRQLTPALVAAAPSLGRLPALSTEWMVGLQFYLESDVPIVAGHTVYLDAPWALTSISQAQFWPDTRLASLGDGTVHGILSVDISDWNTPGMLYGKPASACTAAEIRAEVWAQLQAHLGAARGGPLAAAQYRLSSLDPGLTPAGAGPATNSDPLLVNVAGSWSNRPPAATEIPNLFLASDYVQTNADLACMESANEAGRRAVIAILSRAGSAAAPPALFDYPESPLFAPARAADSLRYRSGLPNVYDEDPA